MSARRSLARLLVDGGVDSAAAAAELHDSVSKDGRLASPDTDTQIDGEEEEAPNSGDETEDIYDVEVEGLASEAALPLRAVEEAEPVGLKIETAAPLNLPSTGSDTQPSRGQSTCGRRAVTTPARTRRGAGRRRVRRARR
jgi:hypothetical protein